MITLFIITIVFGIMLAIAAAGILVLGVIASGILLVVLDIGIGLSPFIGLFFLIRWLSKDEEGGKEKKAEKS